MLRGALNKTAALSSRGARPLASSLSPPATTPRGVALAAHEAGSHAGPVMMPAGAVRVVRSTVPRHMGAEVILFGEHVG